MSHQKKNQAKKICDHPVFKALVQVTSRLGEYLEAADDQFGKEQDEAYQKGVRIIRRYERTKQ